ncbi:MAG: hypothetical protein AAFP08_01795 [Bacteroidota bacterium]
MRYLLCTYFFAFWLGTSIAQAPESINYQAVFRDGAGQLITNESLNIVVAITADTTGPSIAVDYGENHQLSTNAFGQLELELGAGNNPTGELSDLDWSDTEYFLFLSIDYQSDEISIGPTQLRAVPYAFAATTAERAQAPWREGENLDIYYNDGPVGIGVVEPLSRLHIAEVGDPTLRLDALGFGAGDPTIALNRGSEFSSTDWRIQNDGGSLDFDTASDNFVEEPESSRMRLTSTGNLGIGTEVPARRLDVQGTGDQYIRLSRPEFESGTVNQGIEFVDNGNGRDWRIRTNGSAYRFETATSNFTGAATSLMQLTNVGKLYLGENNFPPNQNFNQPRFRMSGNDVVERAQIRNNLTTNVPSAAIELLVSGPNNAMDWRMTNRNGELRIQRNTNNFESGENETMLSINDGNGNLNMHFHRIVDLEDPTQGDHAVTLSFMNDAIDAAIADAPGWPELISSSQGTMTWVNCCSTCRTLNEGGSSDWTIPSMEQLAHFAGTNLTGLTWTSTPFGNTENYYAMIISTGQRSAQDKDNFNTCRCVR